MSLNNFARAGLRAGVATAALVVSAQAAAAPAVAFRIQPQPVSRALHDFSAQSGYRLVYPSQSVAGLMSEEINGVLPPETVLHRLLRGTPLRVAWIKDRMISLTATQQAQVVRVAAPQRFVQAEPAVASGALEPAPDLASTSSQPAEEILVVGSQIRGATTTGALPVAVVGQAQIQATGAVSAGDLFRTLPEAGDVTFNEQFLGGNSPNAARGDVSTVSLRGLGQGNTLVLINGRRMVVHPTSQADGSVPVFGYNVNAVPIDGLERVEILRDGAAALYGSDAVAGVINNVLRSDYKGVLVNGQYGFAEDSNLRELQISGVGGFRFNEDRGRISVFGGFTQRSRIRAGDQEFTSSLDRRPLVAGTSFANVANFDTRANQTPWGVFQTPASAGVIRTGGVALTNASGQFHIQPGSNDGCNYPAGAGICFDEGPNTSPADRNLRFDPNRSSPELTVTPTVKRYNLFGMLRYDLTDDIQYFGEAGYYRGDTSALIGPTSVLNVSITVPAANYYNPFGPIGSPSRLPNLNIPAAGLPVTLSNYVLADVGTRRVDVTNEQWRFLGGLRGTVWGWDWESAGLYSKATVTDTSDGVSNTLFQRALSRSTPDAYNPFNGSTISAPSTGDATPSRDLTSFVIRNTRSNRTTLALWDAKLSNAHLFSLPAGDLGIAIGGEVRRETYRDDRDPRQDGTITFTNSVTGSLFASDLMQASPSLDVSGRRTVLSAYGELSIPVIGPDMNVPLVQAVNVQVAGRFEDYSDVGSVAKPKIAASWDVIDGVRLRGSWSQGFRAPNLETLNTPQLQRIYGGIDYIQCEADLRARRIASFATCSRNVSVISVISGNPDLKPETSNNYSFGAVLRPRFLPSWAGDLTFTIDRWGIKQKGIVGIVSDQNALILDYMQRLSGGTNPAVSRLATTASDEAIFAGTGIAPVGQIASVSSQFLNLLPRDVQGLDLGLSWKSPRTDIGDFALSLNGSHLIKFFQDPTSVDAQLLAAQKAGQISGTLPINGAANLVRDGGRPKWRVSANATWTLEDFSIGAFTQYIGSVNNTGVLNPAGDIFQVGSTISTNLYAQYRWNEDGVGGTTSFRLGVRNLTDKKPPLAATGYLGTLYQPVARYWYFSVQKTF